MSEAARLGNEGKLQRILRELKIFKTDKVDSGRWTVEDVTAETEAWREHRRYPTPRAK